MKQPMAPEAMEKNNATINLIILFKDAANNSARSDGDASIICIPSIVCTRSVVSAAFVYHIQQDHLKNFIINII